MSSISDTSPVTAAAMAAVGFLFTALMKFINDTLKQSRQDTAEARAETVAVRKEAKAEREETNREIVDTLKDLARAQEAQAEAQEAQYLISDGLIRAVSEANGLPPPKIPPPAPVRKRAPERAPGGGQ